MAAGKARFMLDFVKIFGQSTRDDALRSRIEQRALDMIRERTAEGRDRNGKAFPPYSEAYKNSLQFKAAGKDGTVNMTLFGDMLGTMDVVDRTRSASWIGWDDELQNAKAWRHTTGDDGMPKRDFLGLTAAETRALRGEFIDSLRESDQTTVSETDRETLSIIDRIYGLFGDGNE